MNRLAAFATTSLALLALPSCVPQDEDAPSGQPAAAPVFQPGDPASLQLAERLATEHLARIAPDLAADLTVRRVHIDDAGRAFARVAQTYAGIPVFGAEAVVALDETGGYAGIIDGFRHDVRAETTAKIDAADAVARAIQSRGPQQTPVVWGTDLQVLIGHGKDRLVHRVVLDYVATGVASRPVVFVDAVTGAVVWSYEGLETAKVREVHNLNHGTTLPGPLARTEGGAATGDADVDINYGLLGWTYDCYSNMYGRDSFDGAGAKLISSVHYSTNYVNAFWDGTQMVYGDGDNIDSKSLAISMDVTAHELTHAVTERTSNLTYSGESGGLNEAMSDIFGNTCEWLRDNNGNTAGPTSANNFLVGEEVWLSSPALRYMADPALDGISLDFWTSSAGNVDVHYSSGIANLAYYLLTKGGTHPRGKSSTVVTGIGIFDAGKIFYRANTTYLVPNSTFADARVATIRAATDLFGATSQQVAQTANAWTAVGVLPPPDYHVIDTRTSLASSTSLSFNYPANGATAIKFQISGGTGDADIYVRRGSAPTLTAYDCRPYTSGNAETCEFNPAGTGTYYVMINAYAAFSGVTLTVSAAGGGGGPTTETSCNDGIDNDADGNVDCADTDCTGNPVCTPATWTVISSTDFESGAGPYTIPGTDAARVSGTFASSGTWSVRLRDNTKTSLFTTTTGMSLAGKTQLRIQYSAIASSMENGEDYFVELSVGGGAWTTVGNFKAGTDFTNNVRQAKDLQVNLSGTSNVKVRFRCDASADDDQVYIDDVVISAR